MTPVSQLYLSEDSFHNHALNDAIEEPASVCESIVIDLPMPSQFTPDDDGVLGHVSEDASSGHCDRSRIPATISIPSSVSVSSVVCATVNQEQTKIDKAAEASANSPATRILEYFLNMQHMQGKEPEHFQVSTLKRLHHQDSFDNMADAMEFLADDRCLTAEQEFEDQQNKPVVSTPMAVANKQVSPFKKRRHVSETSLEAQSKSDDQASSDAIQNDFGIKNAGQEDDPDSFWKEFDACMERTRRENDKIRSSLNLSAQQSFTAVANRMTCSESASNLDEDFFIDAAKAEGWGRL